MSAGACAGVCVHVTSPLASGLPARLHPVRLLSAACEGNDEREMSSIQGFKVHSAPGHGGP